MGSVIKVYEEMCFNVEVKKWGGKRCRFKVGKVLEDVKFKRYKCWREWRFNELLY